MKKVDIKAITAKAKKQTNKSKTSLSFDQDLYIDFQKKCEKEGVSVTRVLEEFMKEYVK